MRSALGFLSLLGFGVLAAGVVTVVVSGPFGDLAGAAEGAEVNVDLASLLIGLFLGLVLSALARVSWSELPARFVSWFYFRGRMFFRLGMAACFLGVLLLY